MSERDVIMNEGGEGVRVNDWKSRMKTKATKTNERERKLLSERAEPVRLNKGERGRSSNSE